MLGRSDWRKATQRTQHTVRRVSGNEIKKKETLLANVPEPTLVAIDELVRSWDDAERAIRISETLGQTIPLTAINELRNSGRHVVGMLQSLLENRQPPDLDLEIIRAIAHLHLAKHDALDAAVAYLLRQLDDVLEQTGSNRISLEVKEEIALLKRNLGELIARNRSGEDRYDDSSYELIESELIRAEKTYRTLINSAEYKQIQKASRENLFDRILSSNSIFVYLSSILALVSTIIAAIYRLQQ